MQKQKPFWVSKAELERAAAFRSALRRFVARTNDVSAGAGLTSQRYDLLLAIKTGDGETSTVGELVTKLSLPQPAVTELVKRAEEAGLIERSVGADRRVSILRVSEEADERLMQAFVALREERRQLAEAMRAVDASFRAFARSQDEFAE
jgi:DNA-binding MarR family transcriptional regulator